MTATTMSAGILTQIDTVLFFEDKIDHQLFQRISARIAKEEDITLEESRKILDGAIGFLLLCAKDPMGSHAPSVAVDIGWHAFLMYTRDYANFCQQNGERFIHHHPSDDGSTGSMPKDTVTSFLKHNIPFHAEQWEMSANNCVSCDPRCNSDPGSSCRSCGSWVKEEVRTCGSGGGCHT